MNDDEDDDEGLFWYLMSTPSQWHGYWLRSPFGACDECTFWDNAFSKFDFEGLCRRFPPNQPGTTRWPVTDFDDTCGEFQQKG